MRNNRAFVVTGLGAAILDAEMSVKRKYRFCKYTEEEEEKEELCKYQQQRLLDEFDYILNKYGWKYAEEFYNARRSRFEEYNIEVNLKIPHCEYSKDNQCDITCAFFNGRCSYD